MLSKLFASGERNDESQDVLTTSLTEVLVKRFRHVRVTPIAPGGTLGVFFQAEADGQTFFVKTHLFGEPYHGNLQKESLLLTALYGDALFLLTEETMVLGQPLIFLCMDYLSPLTGMPAIKTVRDIISSYQRPPASLPLGSVSMLHGFDVLLTLCAEASEALLRDQMLSPEIMAACSPYFYRLMALDNPASYTLCHGDLSNKNMLTKDGRYYIIDWEDAFLGPPAYDLCYWMTFFDQRHLYAPEIFTNMGVDSDTATGYMLLIVLLKCYISYRRNTHHNNQISFDLRLLEILALQRGGEKIE